MINYENFLEWVNSKFSDVKTQGDEIKINSIFTSDTKQHLYCNTRKNSYHCWKTDKSGNLFHLVSLVDKIPYGEAVELLGGNNEIRNLESKLKKLFSEKKEEIKINSLKLPENSYKIESLPKEGRDFIKSNGYLEKRKIPIKNIYYCVSGEYAERIVIPYLDSEGNLIYWNSRSMKKDAFMRYRGPENKGVGKSDVVFATDWNATKIYLTEGEFDAISLNSCGFAGWALGGKEIHDKQMNFVRGKKICLSFDNDKYGRLAINKLGDKLLKEGIEVSYVLPPEEFKDWNNLLICKSEKEIFEWIKSKEAIYDWKESLRLSMR